MVAAGGRNAKQGSPLPIDLQTDVGFSSGSFCRLAQTSEPVD